jgi:hypothetical protein
MLYGFYLPTRGLTATRDGILALAREAERLGLRWRWSYPASYRDNAYALAGMGSCEAITNYSPPECLM